MAQAITEKPTQQITEKSGDMEIDLIELLYLFRNKLVLILIFFILGGLLAYGYTYFFEKNVYHATSKIFVVSASSGSVLNLSDLSLGTSLAEDYQQLLVCRPMLESVIKNLGLNVTCAELGKMLKITNPGKTRILEIAVSSPDPELPVKVANELAHLSESWFPEVMESNPPSVFEEASECTVTRPAYIKNTLIGAFIGAILIYGLNVLRYMLDDTIRSADELERYFGVSPLTTIPEEKSLGSNKTSDSSAEKLNASRRSQE